MRKNTESSCMGPLGLFEEVVMFKLGLKDEEAQGKENAYISLL